MTLRIFAGRQSAFLYRQSFGRRWANKVAPLWFSSGIGKFWREDTKRFIGSRKTAMAQLDKLDSNGSNEPDISVPKTVEPNVIILTSGLSGSSVLTALICRAGYWSGDRTHKKPHYDTFENERLIELDCRIIAEAGYRGNYLLEFSPEAIAEIEASY